ncbi:MDS1 and EVI1 complex locus protein EVI1-A isoform X1 [Tachysurus ichikawai]
MMGKREKLNSSHFEDNKTDNNHRSHDLDEEEGEEPGVEEEEAELCDANKPANKSAPCNLVDNVGTDINDDELDYDGETKGLLDCKSSPQRFDEEEEEEEEHGVFPALDHIRHFSTEEAELSDGDITGFDSAHLSEPVKQPLYRKSKSQV